MTRQNTFLTLTSLAELRTFHQPPCISLYQPTHRSRPDNQQDPIRFRNLIKDLEKSIRREYPAVETRLLLEPFESLAHDHDFWNRTRDGLAVLGGSGFFRVFRLQRPVAELAVVADSFHTKPLRRILQSADRYQVLGLSLHKIQLFEGDRDELEEVDLAPGVPRTLTEALGEELTEPHQTVASYGGVGAGSTSMHHGQGGKSDEEDIDAERFFRAIDRAVLEHHSRPSGMPLILAALPEHHHLFRQVSHNPFLMETGLAFNPDALPIGEFRDRAWEIVEQQNQAQMPALAENFTIASSKGLASDDLAQVAQAAGLRAGRDVAGRGRSPNRRPTRLRDWWR